MPESTARTSNFWHSEFRWSHIECRSHANACYTRTWIILFTQNFSYKLIDAAIDQFSLQSTIKLDSLTFKSQKFSTTKINFFYKNEIFRYCCRSCHRCCCSTSEWFSSLFTKIQFNSIWVMHFQALTDEQKAKVGEYVKTCSGEANVSPADLAAAKTNPSLDTKDPKLQVCEHFDGTFSEWNGYLWNFNVFHWFARNLPNAFSRRPVSSTTKESSTKKLPLKNCRPVNRTKQKLSN